MSSHFIISFREFYNPRFLIIVFASISLITSCDHCTYIVRIRQCFLSQFFYIYNQTIDASAIRRCLDTNTNNKNAQKTCKTKSFEQKYSGLDGSRFSASRGLASVGAPAPQGRPPDDRAPCPNNISNTMIHPQLFYKQIREAKCLSDLFMD